jgi:hypothetical protein
MLRCRYHELKKATGPVADHLAFTCLLYHPQMKLVYCGLTARDSDILYAFDPVTKEFQSLGYARYAEKYEVKIHRSLELDDDGTLYAATACLHELKERLHAPGGKLFHYDPRTGRCEILGIPVKYDYIQTISLDRKRRIIYGFTYPVFKFFRFDLATRRVKDFDYIGSITHISAIDDAGCLWGTYDPAKHNLFKYDPDADAITFFDHSVLPRGHGVGVMYAGAGPVDVMLNAGDGFIYVGTTTAELVRLDPRTAEVTYLGKPFPGLRMPALLLAPDGLFYGAGGSDGNCFFFSYDRERESFTPLGTIQDEKSGLRCVRVHDMCRTPDGTFYVAETDTSDRSAFLWECRLEG